MLGESRAPQVGDICLIALGGSVASHAVSWVRNNRILHHVQDRLSSVDRYMGVFRNNTLARIRHKDVPEERKIEYGTKYRYFRKIKIYVF